MITIQFDIQTEEQRYNLKKGFDYLRSLKLPFQIFLPFTGENEDEFLENLVIRDRLVENYVKSGEWEKMDDEERQDAVLLEKMVFQEEQPDYKVYSVEESEKLLADLKAEINED